MTKTNTSSNIVETIFKTQEGYNECDHCQSVLSPAAYFVKLMETVDKYIEQTNSKHSLKSRRPDLMEMKLDCDNTNKAELYLEIVNKVIEKKLKKDFGPNVLTELTTTKYPFNLPANIHLMGIRAYLKKYNLSLADIYQELVSTSDNTSAESLGLSPEEYKLIASSQTGELKLKELCGIPNDKPLNELKNVDQLNDYMSICYDRLQLILNKYEEEVTVSSSDIKVLLDSIGSDRLQLLLDIYSNASSDLDKLKLLLSDIEQSKLQLFLEDYSRETGINYSELKLLLGSYIKGSGIDNNALGKLIEDHNQNEENSDQKKDEKISLKQLLDTYENFKDWVLKSLLNSRKKDEKDHYELELLIKIYRRATSAVHSKLHKLLNNYKKGNGVTRDRLRLLINDIDNKKLKLISDFCKGKSCGALKDDANQDLKSIFDKFKEFTINSLLNAYNKVKGLTNDKKLSISEKEIKNLSNESLCFLHHFIRLANKLDWSYSDLAQTLVVTGKQDIDEDVIKKIAQIKRFTKRFENKKQLLNETLGFHSADVPENAYDVITGLDSTDQSVNEVKQFKKLLSLILQAYPDKEKFYRLLSDLDTSEDEIGEDILSSEDIRVITSQNVAEDHLKEAYKIDSWEQTKDISKFAENSSIEVNKLKSLANVYNDINGLEQISSMNRKVSRTNIATAIVDNEAIFFGGSENNKSSNKVDVYNITTEKWEENEPLSNGIDTCTGKWKRYTHEARQNASVAIVGNNQAIKKVIFFGGKKSDDTHSAKIEIYDTAHGKWEKDFHASEARENAAVAVIGNKAIFFSGRKSNNQCSPKVDIYNANETDAKKCWKIHTIGEARENVAVAVVGDKAIFFGGKKGQNQYLPKVDIYDDKSRKWKSFDIGVPFGEVEVVIEGNKANFVGKDSSNSIHRYIIGYPTVVEQFIENVNTFTKVGLEGKDIKDIIKHGNIFGIERPWSISIDQMQVLLKYKRLEKKFASSTPNFSEYIEWLYSSKYGHTKIVEEISKLTKWNKETLKIIQSDKDFETCFGNDNNPIDSLLKIESIINMINESGIGVDLLLRLKNLHNINLVNDTDNKYEKVATTLRSSITLEEEDKIIADLEEKKRDILVGFTISKYKGSNEITIKNTRDLYNFLLIDVEMSGCAKISPLKAALNSMQLYIHRCILGLEEGVTVNQDPKKGLSEEMWNLLDNYREWEAAKKITLYPENYLNPTLHKSATAEYKALQNTLMQGDITDEAVVQAYVRYFEDFAQLVNLRIVDTYFADNRLYILGRTQAEPYAYYYRVADFEDGKSGSQQTWKPWNKIEAQIPVSIARIIHAFGKVFIFWLQKTEKEKQVEDISINDSILSVYYVFKKVDGNWSAQQKLPNEVYIDSKFESEIRRYFLSRDWNESNKRLCESFKAENKKVHYSKNGKWVENRPAEEAIEYFEDKVKVFDGDIKRKVQESKDISKGFDGKLKVALNEEKQAVLIISNEKGFNNKRFVLEKDLTSDIGDIRYLGDDIARSIKEAKQSIEDFYKKKKEEEKDVVNQQKAAVQKKIEKEQRKKVKKENDLADLRNKKEDKEKSWKVLQEKVRTIENSVKERKKKEEDLQKEIEELIKQLDNIQQKESIQDNLPRELIEKGKLKAAIDNFTQRLTESKKSVKNKKEIQEQLTKLETKATELAGKINQLINEKTIEGLQKEQKELEKSTGNYKEEIDKLSKKIKDDEGRIREFEEETRILQEQKEEIEKGNTEAAMQAKHKKLDEKKQREIDLVTELIKQKDKDNQIDRNKYKDKAVSNLINDLYGKAYTERSEAILVPKEQHLTLDFNGFYGIYLWEIFFHIPTLAAYLFNQEQKFAEARKWYQYILNPTKKGCDAWQFIPFKIKCDNKDSDEKCSSEKLISFPDPYKEADNRRISFEKYVIISYVDNLIDWGDMLFSQNSWEGINQATMLYIRAWNLLGSKPKRKEKFSNEAQNICELSGNKYNVCKIEAIVPVNAKTNTKNGSGSAEKALDITTYCNYFCTPENKDFVGLWGRIEDRLYKIRHCLDIKGKHLELPLFQPPIDPRQLISAIGSGAVRISQITKVPHYRFKYMISYAKSIADNVIQIGSELLNVLEKRDAEALTLLYNKQEGIMANLITVIKEKAIEALKEEAKALDVSLSSANDRRSHYEKLINDDLSSLEREAKELFEDAHATRIITTAIRGIAAGTHLIPTVFGFACGSFQPGFSTEAGANVADSIANLKSDQAQIISTSASYERREQDWELQKIMATHDVEQIGYQISANKVSQANAKQDLKAHKV